MRRNGGMGWRETRKGLTSFRSLLALSPALSSSSLSSLFPSRFSLYHLLLRISLVSTPFPLYLASSLSFSLFLSVSLSFCISSSRPSSASRRSWSPRWPVLHTVSLSCVLLGSPPFIIHRQGKFIYVLQLILNSQFTIPWLSPFSSPLIPFSDEVACLMCTRCASSTPISRFLFPLLFRLQLSSLSIEFFFLNHFFSSFCRLIFLFVHLNFPRRRLIMIPSSRTALIFKNEL